MGTSERKSVRTEIREMTSDDWSDISSRLAQYNIDHSGGLSRVPGLNISRVLEIDGEVVGGISCRAYYRCLMIDHLWIDENHRGGGYGKHLMLEVEKIAKDKGCISAQTSTYSFQAPEFYQKMGYGVIGVFDGYPNSIKRYYLGKQL